MDGISEALKAKLESKGIHTLRQIGRVVGVHYPTQKKKEELISDIMAIARGEAQPCDRSTRGAPPKSADFDKETVDDIERCRQYYNGVSVEHTPAPAADVFKSPEAETEEE